MERIPVAGPWITELEVAYVTDAARNGWYGHWSDYNDRFEAAFANYIGVPHALSLPSGTSAIHLAMASLGVGPGDEVIVPEITWIASAGPATYLGATPVFVDIDPVTWCISADSLRNAITPRTKAIVVVEVYGSMPDWASLRAVADEYGVPIIEDSAEAIGSAYRNSLAGTFGDVSIFSFQGSKTMTTGEGGMLVTRDERLYRRCLVLRDQGLDPDSPRKRCNDEVAFKYRMGGLQAALGLGQIERIDELVQKKREIFAWYDRELSGLRGITLNAQPAGVFNSYWMTTAILDPGLGITKEQLFDELASVGIDSRIFFYPLSSLPAYRTLPDASTARERNPVAYAIAPWGINLPSALNLTEKEAMTVCAAFRRIVSQRGAAKERVLERLP